MSFQLPTEHKAISVRPRWAGAAFLVEAMLLLLFLTASMAVFTQLFAEAAERSNQSLDLSAAVVAGSAAAERFAADPTSVPERAVEDNMLVVCDTQAEPREAGVLYHATISVYPASGESTASGANDPSNPLFVVETAHYDKGVS